MTLKTKIILSFIVILTLTSPTVLLSVVYLNQGLDIVKGITQEEQIIQAEMKIQQLADRISIEIFAAQVALISHLSLNTSASEKRVRDSLNKIQQYVSQGKELSPSRAGEFERIQQIVSEYIAIFSAGNQKNQLSKASSNTPAAAFPIEEQAVFERTLEHLGDEIKETADKISDFSRQQIEQHSQKIDQYSQESHRKSEQSRRNVITTMILSLLVGAGFVFGLTQRLIRPLKRITHLINQVKAGDPHLSMPLMGKDEIGQLAHAITQFINAFNTYDTLKTQKIREQGHLLQTVCNLSGVGLLVLDMDGQVLFHNQLIQSLMTEGGNHLFGKDIEKIVFDRALVRVLKEALKNRTPIDAVDFPLKRKDGIDIRVTFNVAFLDAEGTNSAVVILWGLSKSNRPGEAPDGKGKPPAESG